MGEIQEIAETIVAKRRLAMPKKRIYSGMSTPELMQLVKNIGSKLARNFVIDDENMFAYENILNWLLGQPFKCVEPATGEIITGYHYKGIYLAGNCGSGKSMLLTIVAAIGSYYNITYQFDGEEIPLTWADFRTDELCSEFILTGAEVVQKAKNLPVLCLNDFGSEPSEQLYMGNRINIIRQIIESRADRIGQFTLISSNLPMNSEEIESKYGARVSSRLKQMCNYFVLAGTDRRK